MSWIDKKPKGRGWLGPRAGTAAPAASAEPEDPLSQLLPDDLKEKSSFNAREVARICGCHTPRTVHNWIHDGLLQVVRLPGGKFRIPRPNLQAFLAQYNKKSPTTKKVENRSK